jgi:hypothetical protein
MSDSVFQQAASKLLTEIFDGPPGAEAYILNAGDPGLHRQLDAIPAAVASRQSIPDKPSIAAHIDHVNFGLSLLARWLAGDDNAFAGADGTASWRRLTVTDDEWRRLRQSLRETADSFRKGVGERTAWDEVTAAGAISTIAHTAYHLGAIRQILAAAR